MFVEFSCYFVVFFFLLPWKPAEVQFIQILSVHCDYQNLEVQIQTIFNFCMFFFLFPFFFIQLKITEAEKSIEENKNN